VAVVGGGPSGAVAARLLASWGHRVTLITRPVDSSRALANSLPPSTRKLLAQVGILDIVERVGYRTTGNTLWWGERTGQVEPFSIDGSTWGYQVDRVRLDTQLVDAAARSGVRVEPDARVQQVEFGDAGVAVSYVTSDGPRACAARMVLDCSGRSGVVATARRLRRHVPGGRMQALVGVWERPGGWRLQNPTHTFIETCDEGWAWSIPTTDAVRHVGIMVDGATSRVTRGPSIEATYRSQLALTPRIDRQVSGSRLARVFACDASVYTALQHAGPGYLLVGDAGTTLNPLSSFGVKKALTSAWLAAIVAHTCLVHPERAAEAQAFFSRWESQVWQVNLQRSREFATEAFGRHRSAFWSAQSDAVVDEAELPLDESALLTSADVRAALSRLRECDRIVFSRDAERTFVSAPIVRGHAIEVEDAVALGPGPRDVLRYVRGIDLVAVAMLAPRCDDIPLMFEQYVSRYGPVPLPDFLACLSLLTARGVLRANARVPLARS
jgi:flavin-dependent dehydrogenase